MNCSACSRRATASACKPAVFKRAAPHRLAASSCSLRCPCRVIRQQRCSAHKWPHSRQLLDATAAALLPALLCEPAMALTLHAEPSNALSLPTWAIHVSSVVEWGTGIWLMWQYAEVANRPYWKGMCWAMLPSLASAMCACTWHWFYNAPDLEWLVAAQGGLTVLGNITLWLGSYHVFKNAQPQPQQ